MRWLFGILGAYVALVVAFVAGLPYAAHAAAYRVEETTDGHGHTLSVYRDLRLPFGLNGRTPPLTVVVRGRHGDVLDDRRLPDAVGAGVWAWHEHTVTVEYEPVAGNMYLTDLDLEQ